MSYKKNRELCIFMVLIMLCVCFSPSTYIAYAKNNKKEDDRKDYMILCDNKSSKDIIKDKYNDRIVVNHQKADEQYLDCDNITNLSLGETEKTNIEKNNKFIIEPDREVIGLSNSKKVQVPETYQEYNNKCESEYSDDPSKFVPCKEVYGKNANEKVPWNISLVVGDKNLNKYNAKGIRIAIIDSGVDVHDDLATCGWVDFSDKKNGYKPVDNSGHGTEMAGIIAARKNGIGLIGIANGADIYSVKVLDENNKAKISSVIKGINWCIENDIDVINMSFGMDSYSEILEKTIKEAAENNIIMVAAAGNEGKTQYPAKYDDVISVGGVTKNLSIAENSSRGDDVDVYAPCEDVNTTGILGSYVFSDGTSIAAAHVTGVVSVLKKKYPNMSSKMLMSELINSSVRLDTEKGGLVNLKTTLKNCKRAKDSKKANERPAINDLNLSSDNENDYVEGSWSSDKWKGVERSTGTGHYGMINNLDTEYFARGASDYTQKVKNRWIVADSAYLIDEEIFNSKWRVINSSEKTYKYSPYHANGHYTFNQIYYFTSFLYELSRRRLVLGSQLDLDYTNYNNKDEYKGVYIPVNMKKTIVADMKVLYQSLKSHYSSAGINMDSVTSRGYMVLGVLLHAEGDYLCHRAKVTKNMISSSADGSVGRNDSFGDTYTNSYINRGNFSDYWKCYRYINKYGSMPINRLKEKLNSTITIYCNGKTYSNVKPNQAYEDNPFFYSNRYAASLYQVENTLKDMKNSKTTTTLYGFDSWGVLLYDAAFNYNFENEKWVV